MPTCHIDWYFLNLYSKKCSAMKAMDGDLRYYNIERKNLPWSGMIDSAVNQPSVALEPCVL